MIHSPITASHLYEEYHRAGYAILGITFAHCMRVAPMRAALTCAVKARRQKEAMQARGVGVEKQVKGAA